MKMWVVFQKGYRLRHIGHLDLLRTMHRALRRSQLPIAFSQGFNPHVLMNFAAPLSVGVTGLKEIMEIPLTREVTVEEFEQKLRQALPEDLVFVSARKVEDNHAAPMALLHSAIYEAKLENPQGLFESIPSYLKQEHIEEMRKTKSGVKPCDIRPLIYDITVLEPDTLCMHVALNDKGTCKPDLLLASLAKFAEVEKPSAKLIRTQLLGKWQEMPVPLENL